MGTTQTPLQETASAVDKLVAQNKAKPIKRVRARNLKEMAITQALRKSFESPSNIYSSLTQLHIERERSRARAANVAHNVLPPC